jgi:CheY-like chemotaxis protein
MITGAAGTLLARLKETVRHADRTAPVSILVVDDEEQVRLYVGRVLEQAGYRAVMAGNATEALRISAADGPFDVLLTDLIMPQICGDELARRLRVTQPDLPVLYLTGFSDRLFTERSRLWEGEAFLEKPCTPKGLLEAVSQIRMAVSGGEPETS